MSRTSQAPKADLLFDLPLDSVPSNDAPVDAQAANPPAAVEPPQIALDLPADDTDPPSPEVEAPIRPRSLAGAIDFIALAAALGFAWASLGLLELPLDRRAIAPLALFLVSFSFLYHVVPLAFWGQTPGMAAGGIHARSRSGDFLTIQQCTLRWLGWLATVAAAGLPALLALSGVSVSDLVSRTRTFVRRADVH